MKKKKAEKINIEEEVIEDAKIEENAPSEKQDANIPEYYTLKIGETLKDVAEKFSLSEKELEKINGEVVGTNQIKLK